MEAFEQFVKVALQHEGLVVDSGVKFPITRQTKRADRVEFQTHGYEVDLVGASRQQLVLATVKSFFGSIGVQAREVSGGGRSPGAYRLLNDPAIRDGVIAAAAGRYGYKLAQVRLRLYVGKWARTGRVDNRASTREWCARQIAGGGQIEVFDVSDVVPLVRKVASGGMYLNDPVVVTLKVLAAAEAEAARQSLPHLS